MISQEKIDFIRSLERRNRISAEAVIEAARPEDSPIHDEFEWDKDRAWHSQAIATAERLIRAVKVEMVIQPNVTISTVRYVRDPDDAVAGNYINLTVAARSHQKALKILEAEMARVRGAILRAKGVAAGLGLIDELDQMLEQADRVINRAHASATEEARV